MTTNYDTIELEIIRSYSSLFQAEIDKALLESNGITAAINNQQIGNMFPGLDMITLSVDKTLADKAIKIIDQESNK